MFFSILGSSVKIIASLPAWTVKLHNRMSNCGRPLAAVCQLNSTPDKKANLCAAKELLEEAAQQGASVAFLPEAFDYIGSSQEETLALSESLEGHTMTRYSQMARKLNIWLSLGGFHERGPAWDVDQRTYNSHVVINNKGQIVSIYRKSHLFDVELPEKGVSMKESAFTIPGPTLVSPVQTPVGKVGLGVCYDLRFPELSLALQKNGAEILTFPSAFTEVTGPAHWEVLLRARAIENQCYVLAAAQVGRHHDSRSSYGHALAVDPWGVVMGDCGGEKAGMLLVEVDLDKMSSIRTNMPLKKHRRDENFYTRLSDD
ncbi:deaminated glutathione amidase isoform X1 [Entelurus aequoreus]|uniref:deaminated glutathione amidase isoform X1 n=2 Tax=Entelurus aequoreus TaxID=161455 RepID=UPI002B1D2147|nr:deaminated glutathione amidase isoform X1 [Entelurus aequoreus]